MPIWEITDSKTGRVFEIEGNDPPTDSDLDELISQFEVSPPNFQTDAGQIPGAQQQAATISLPGTPETERRVPSEISEADVSDWLAQGGFGIGQGFWDLGRQGLSVLQATQQPIFETGPVGWTLAGPRPKGLATDIGEFLRESAQEAGRRSDAIEEIAKDVPGPEFMRGFTRAGMSVPPAIAAGPLGLPGVIAASGLQAGGATLAEAQDAYAKQGLSPQQSFQKALPVAALDAAQTAALTLAAGKLFGQGAEGLTLPMKKAALNQGIGNIFKQATGEALEEGAQEFVSNALIAQYTYNPEMTFKAAFKAALEAAGYGAILGGGMAAGHQQLARLENARQDDAALDRAIEEAADEAALLGTLPGAAQEQAVPRMTERPEGYFANIPIEPTTKSEQISSKLVEPDLIAGDTPLNPGGSQEALPEALKEKSTRNNSLKAFAEANGVPFVEGDTPASILAKVSQKSNPAADEEITSQPEKVADAAVTERTAAPIQEPAATEKQVELMTPEKRRIAEKMARERIDNRETDELGMEHEAQSKELERLIKTHQELRKELDVAKTTDERYQAEAELKEIEMRLRELAVGKKRKPAPLPTITEEQQKYWDDWNKRRDEHDIPGRIKRKEPIEHQFTLVSDEAKLRDAGYVREGDRYVYKPDTAQPPLPSVPTTETPQTTPGTLPTGQTETKAASVGTESVKPIKESPKRWIVEHRKSDNKMVIYDTFNEKVESITTTKKSAEAIVGRLERYSKTDPNYRPITAPWAMTLEQWKKWADPSVSFTPQVHESLVRQAFREGKPVPLEVLKDYPDLVTAPPVATAAPVTPAKVGEQSIDLKKRIGLMLSTESMKPDGLVGVNIYTDTTGNIVAVGNPQDIFENSVVPPGLINSTIGFDGRTGTPRFEDSKWGKGVNRQSIIKQITKALTEDKSSTGTSRPGDVIAVPKTVPPSQPEGAPPTSPQTAAGVKRVVRGITGRQRFSRETELIGPDILSFIEEFGGMVSKSEAHRSRGKEWWLLNKSLYDDAAPLAFPHHNVIYKAGRNYPDQIAQAAYEARVLKSPDVNELWSAIHKASQLRANIFKEQSRQAKDIEATAREYEAWEKAIAKGGKEVVADELKVGDVMDVEGERVEVTEVDPQTGDVTLKDGRTFGTQVVGENKKLFVEKLIESEEIGWDVPVEQAPKPELPKLSKEPVGKLTKAEQREFELLTEKLKAAREAGGPVLTTDETQRYESFLAKVGQGKLLETDEGANVRAIEAEVKRLREKAVELERQSNLALDRYYKSNIKEVAAKHRAAAEKLMQEAADTRIKADELERRLPRDKQRGDDLTLQADESGRVEPETKPEGEQGALFDRPTRGKLASIYEMADEDLADFLDEQFGDTATGTTPLAAGRRKTYDFPTFDSFRDWMDARYAERDLDGMKLAFAEADRDFKVSYIKSTRAADAHKKAWVNHLATGSPLPTEDGPRPRTSPLPGTDGKTPTATPPREPGRPSEPPPPPREPSKHHKFDIMALTQLLRQKGLFPVMNKRLMRAYGRFVPGTKAVELKKRLLWDTKLANRVLGHEIGHFIDLAIPIIGKGKQFAQRLKPLYDFRKRVWEAKELRNEARSLSRRWRGPFNNGDSYRDTAVELYADFLSAMFNDPEWVNQTYPKLYDAFQDLRDAKLGFKSAYREIETWLQGGAMAKEFIDQQTGAVERTLAELEKERKPVKASFMGRLKFGTVSLWNRAFEKEGRPRTLGDAITDDLEYNTLYAAKENALMADDFTRLVTPELQKVDSDPIQARAKLSAYSQAVRTIGERRAAGKWIEDNPKEARELLARLLEIDAALKSKFAGDLANAADNQLYDLSAAVFREIHDRGEKYAQRISRTIDKWGLGVGGQAAMMAFNVRGKLLNPGGLTPDNATGVLRTLENELGLDRYQALERAAKALRDLMFSTQQKMHAEGLISDKTWNELILPNQDNYVPYAVLDYFEGYVRAGVMPQTGTAKDVADVAAAVQLKIAAANVWRQRQRQTKLLMDVYEKGGTPVTPGEKLAHASDLERIRNKHQNDDVSRSVLWVNGDPHLVEFGGDKGKLLENAMSVPSFYEHIAWISEASDITHRIMQLYTQFSVPFLFWRNPLRGARTQALRAGFGRIAQQMTPAQLKENLTLAKNYADAAFGAPMLPEVRQMVESGFLLPPRLSQALVRDAANLRDLLTNHTVLANQVRSVHVGKPAWWKAGALGRQAVIASEKLFATYEAFEKIYTYHAALKKGLSPKKASALAQRAGIPKPGVGGKWSLAMEVWFPWTRVHIQGARSTLDVMRDPELGAGFKARFAVTELLPRTAKVAIASGVIAGALKWALRDDDDDDGVMAEFFRKVSPYKMALDDTVPLYFYDPRTGKVHYLWEFKRGKDIPKHYEAVSMRIPASEEGRLWGVLLYQMMISTPGLREKTGTPGKGYVENFGQWAVNYLSPGLSPIIETTDSLKDMILLGKNPDDPYRGQPAANARMFDAGGVDRAQAIAGYAMNQAGSFGELAGVMAANFGVMDERALKSMSRRLPTDQKAWNDRLPFIKTALSHDNYADYRDEQSAKLAEDRIRAKARLLMDKEPRALYDFYYRNLNRKEKLTPVEMAQFRLSQNFVNKVWGTLTVNNKPNPNSFYSRAAQAVSPDGSRQLKETVRRDLSTAASPYIAEFMRLNKLPSNQTP